VRQNLGADRKLVNTPLSIAASPRPNCIGSASGTARYSVRCIHRIFMCRTLDFVVTRLGNKGRI
jgi:hypothetical protein